MPRIGFGTNSLTGDVGTRSVADAISVGYRLIDVTYVYGNEEVVGAGLRRRDKTRRAVCYLETLG